MDAPSLWWLQDQYEIYKVPNTLHTTFHQALIVQLVERLNSDQKDKALGPTSGK